MSSNFDFLQGAWATLRDDAVEVERNVQAAPRTCVFYARRTLERTVLWLYDHDSYLRRPYQDNLGALIHEPTFKEILPRSLFFNVTLIHKVGNLAVHSEKSVNAHDALNVTRMLHGFLSWVVRIYSKPSPEIAKFDDTLLPAPTQPGPDRTAAQLQQLEGELAAKDTALAEKQKRIAAQDEEIAQLKQQLAERREENEKSLPEIDYTEAGSRTLFIDTLLREAGWDPHAHDVREFPVTGMPNETGQGFVDYVLWGKDGLPLAVVEAKRTSIDPRQGKRQAELYADCLEKMKGQRPIIFYTNGYETWIWDDRNYPPRQVQGFYKQDELQLLIHRRKTRQPIAGAKPKLDIVERDYQLIAIQRLEETYDTDRQRRALLVMATGTGKTRLSIATVELLMRHNWVRRVLFLADRNALLTQAKRAFKKHLPHTTPVDLTQEKEKDDSRIVFSTYPTMMNLIDEARPDGKRFGVGHFDLIIIDEAHRSIYQKYRAIFEYFDALLLGMTATPRTEVDRDTYRLFELQQDVPTYAYELEEAVQDGYLVSFREVRCPTKFTRQGIKYRELSDEEKAEYETALFDEETGQVPDEVDAGALNRWLFNKSTVDKVLAVLMEKGLKVDGGDKLGKTIIFAANHDHAQFIVERFDANYPQYKGKFCQLIDNQVRYAQSLIDDFSVKAKLPQIAVSVDMLDTGIDVPECLNLVFFKRVRSKTKFWQMIGRGTRLCEDLFGPGANKKFFYLFDVCENLEFFEANPDGYAGSVQEGVKQRIFRCRLDLTNLLARLPERDAALDTLRSELLDQMHQEVTRMNVDNFLVRPHLRQVEKYSQRDAWNDLGPSDLVEIHEHLTGLPTPDEDDEFARRFDLLMLKFQLSIVEGTHDQARYQQQIRDIAQNLAEKETIPAVAAQMEIIDELRSDEFWQNVTLPMLETVRRRLRGLIQFLDREGGRKTVYTDFDDEMGEVADVDASITPSNNLENYRLKVEKFVRENQHHITIHRLKHNQPISAADLEALEAILFSEDGPCSRDDFIETFGTEKPLGKLIREIVGLDPTAAKEAFAQFLSSSTLSADQMTFINQIIDHLVHNGTMDPRELFEPPFTDFHDGGVLGVLPDAAAAIVGTIQKINDNAQVA